MDEPGWSSIDYPGRLRAAMLGVIRDLLSRTADEGLPGEHHFYLSFRTDAPGVQLSAGLRLRYPQEMTIVLQEQFWDLDVTAVAFGVTLRFGGTPQRLTVPFEALTAFVDPSVQFGLRLADRAEPEPAQDATSRDDRAPTGSLAAADSARGLEAGPTPVQGEDASETLPAAASEQAGPAQPVSAAPPKAGVVIDFKPRNG